MLCPLKLTIDFWYNIKTANICQLIVVIYIPPTPIPSHTRPLPIGSRCKRVSLISNYALPISQITAPNCACFFIIAGCYNQTQFRYSRTKFDPFQLFIALQKIIKRMWCEGVRTWRFASTTKAETRVCRFSSLFTLSALLRLSGIFFYHQFSGGEMANLNGATTDLRTTFLQVYSVLKSELLSDPAFEWNEGSRQWVERVSFLNLISSLSRCVSY